ncbi:ORF23 [Retroperitoneal fibromatosis-associated herpesvirus]|uniref:ORF23 n=1 Tax=Retroperitoneal fibromatosis-associated herpesvirus TaxID=111469 RepID=U5NIV0_9GAMA|nr:ORF23 [Retroperitoneal fibromatosis-associated herpesvirus]AGY30706.1 ORF23 [Retroperitoneal fibromatosis-associated herpesvirus]
MQTLSIPDARARLDGGAVILSTGEHIFHVLNSPAAAAMVGLAGQEVPVPMLFHKFNRRSGGSLSLYAPNRPELSLLRIMLSPHPYALNSHLCVGKTDASAGVTLYATPVVCSSDFEETPVLPKCRIVISKSDTYADFKEVHLKPAAPKIRTDAQGRRLCIDEKANTVRTFDPNLPANSLCVTPGHPNTSASQMPGHPKSILKYATADEPAARVITEEMVRIFFAAGQRRPQLGHCPVGAFNTVTIMERANNSIIYLPHLKLTRIQHLYIKHTLLHTLGLENVLPCFESIYGTDAAPVQPHQIEYFKEMVGRVKRRVEDAVFCLNSIEDYNFPEPITTAPLCSPSLQKAMEKYFLMCTPKDRKSAACLGAGIIELICNGTPLFEVLGMLSRHMPIRKECTGSLLKIYSLLTI